MKALDGEHVLAEQPAAWELDRTYQLSLTVRGAHVSASLDGEQIFAVEDTAAPLLGGGIALVVDEGRVDVDSVSVKP